MGLACFGWGSRIMRLMYCPIHLICNSSLKNSVDVVRTGTQPEIQKYLFHSNGAFDKTQSDYEIFDGVSENRVLLQWGW